METKGDQQVRTEAVRQFVEQIDKCLHSGDYSRALDLIGGASAEFSSDAQLSELEQRARDGVKRNAEAQRLITESQESFAQGKSAEAIQLLRKAYELDRSNSLARSILANALVEHANSMAETDWLEAEKLTNQALALNPAHPTAKTIFSLIVELKRTSSVEDWVSRARNLQSSGDLFGALAWVAEGLAVHPNDPKLLQIQDTIHRDQNARRRQSRRHDLEELRRLELEIAAAVDDAAKQALAERIQAVVAKYWTDGEILSVANGLLNRLGLAPPEGSTASRSKSAAVIFHVPRAGTAKPSPPDASRIPTSPAAPIENVAAKLATSNEAPTTAAPDPVAPPEPRIAPPQVGVSAAGSSPVVAVPAPSTKGKSLPLQPKQHTRSNSKALISLSAAAVILIAATFFFTRRHYAQPAVKNSVASSPVVAAPSVAAPALPSPTSTPAVSAQTDSRALPSTPEPSSAASSASPGTSAVGKVLPDNRPLAETGHNFGALLVVVGQDNAKVFLNGIVQRQLTQGGELRLSNLEVRDYFVQVSKSGFEDPPKQEIRIRKGAQARLVFSLQPQPQPRFASLMIQGGAPGATVLIDQTFVGTIQSDGTLSVSNVNPGDHTVELRKVQFKPRQFKKHFDAGGAVSLAAADATLESVPGELSVTFAPADAKVVLVKGNSLTMVSSGVPLSLAAGTYTLTARTADRFARSSTFEVVAGQSKTLNLSLTPAGMSKWEDPGAWKQERDAFMRKGGDFALYGVAPLSGTFVFSAMPVKGHFLQWVLNYTNPQNYILFQVDDSYFDRAVIRNGEKTNEIKIPAKTDKKGFRTLRIRVGPTEIIHEMKEDDNWTVLDRWIQGGANFGSGKFGFYIPGSDQVALSGFAYYPDLNLR